MCGSQYADIASTRIKATAPIRISHSGAPNSSFEFPMEEIRQVVLKSSLQCFNTRSRATPKTPSIRESVEHSISAYRPRDACLVLLAAISRAHADRSYWDTGS